MATIKKIEHYAIENPASVFDEEALTALELAGRTAHKVNEIVGTVDEFIDETNEEIERFEGSMDKRMREVEETTAHCAEKIEEFETTTIQETVVKETARQIAEGSLDHVVVNNIEILGARLDNLLEMEGNVGNTAAEVVDARIGNGGEQYENLGAALRGQTTNIKPLRLNAEGGEWKSDAPVSYYTLYDYTLSASGFNGTLTSTMSESGAVRRDIVCIDVVGGETLLLTRHNEFTTEEINAGAIVFAQDRMAKTSFTLAIGATRTAEFIKLVDEENWVYRINVPQGTTEILFIKRKGWAEPSIYSVHTTERLAWLRLNKKNVTNGIITPGAIDCDTDTFYYDAPYTRELHCYRRMTGSGIIEKASMTGMACCTLDVKEGQVYRLPIGKDVTESLRNYFVFEDADGLEAVSDPTPYVVLKNEESFIYEATIPKGCVKFHTACDSADLFKIEWVIRKHNIPWLEVRAENMTGVELGEKNRVTLDYIGKRIDFEGKTVLCIGDSITAGIYSTTEGSTSTSASGSPIERFCEMVGATYLDGSISGRTMEQHAVEGITGILEMYPSDIVIVALGVNDFMTAKKSSRSFHIVTTAVAQAIRNWMDEDERRVGIFITPVYNDMKVNNIGYDLEYYRKTIFNICVGKDILCVDGGDFPITSTHMSDGIHPTEGGQRIYSRALAHKLT